MRRFGLISLIFLLLGFDSLSAQSLRILAYFRGENYGDKLGYKVAPAGDVNSDGYADVLVGAYGAKKVYLYYGGSPMDTTSDLVFNNIVWGLWNVSDVNNDGFSDFAIGDSIPDRVQLFYGGAILDTTADLLFCSETPGEFFGSSITGGGDINGDNYADIVIGAVNYWNPPDEGRFYVYYGGSVLDSSADWVVTGHDRPTFHFAWSAVNGGDLNKDGFSDVLVGEISNAESIPGRVLVYYGGSEPDTIPDVVIDGPAQLTFPALYSFGEFVAPVGDLNRDGYSDFAVAGMGLNVCVYFGGEVLDSLPGIICQYQGYVACNAGDVNHDGYDDLLAGDEGYGYESGAVFFYFGSSDMDSICDLAIYGGPTDFYFGKSIAGLGDVDGDGVDDFIVGARYTYDPWDRGEAWIFAGDSTLPTDVEEEGHEDLVEFNILEQNYPNPFNSVTIISFKVHGKQKTENSPIRTTLKIYNLKGQLVRVLVDEVLNPGEYRVSWGGRNDQGKEVASGVYFFKLKAGEFIQTKKMVLIR